MPWILIRFALACHQDRMGISRLHKKRILYQLSKDDPLQITHSPMPSPCHSPRVSPRASSQGNIPVSLIQGALGSPHGSVTFSFTSADSARQPRPPLHPSTRARATSTPAPSATTAAATVAAASNGNTPVPLSPAPVLTSLAARQLTISVPDCEGEISTQKCSSPVPAPAKGSTPKLQLPVQNRRKPIPMPNVKLPEGWRAFTDYKDRTFFWNTVTLEVGYARACGGCVGVGNSDVLCSLSAMATNHFACILPRCITVVLATSKRASQGKCPLWLMIRQPTGCSTSSQFEGRSFSLSFFHRTR